MLSEEYAGLRIKLLCGEDKEKIPIRNILASSSHIPSPELEPCIKHCNRLRYCQKHQTLPHLRSNSSKRPYVGHLRQQISGETPIFTDPFSSVALWTEKNWGEKTKQEVW